MSATENLIAPSASDLLDHAADLIDLWGLHHGWFLGPDGSMCEHGALSAASGMVVHVKTDTGWVSRPGEGWSSFKAARNYLDKVGGGPKHSDNATKAQAIAKLREAAERARGEGN